MIPDFSFLPFVAIPIIFIAVIIAILLKKKNRGEGSLTNAPADDTANRLFQEQMQRDMQIHQQTVQTNLQIQNDMQTLQNMQNMNNQ